MQDQSNGYEAVAGEFMALRQDSGVGTATVREWARSLPSRVSVLDLGCGHGVVTRVLSEGGHEVYGIDASETMVAAFRERFPRATVAREAVEDSDFFGRTFDCIVAVGLMFLLSADAQSALIRKVASALNPGGRFLFTAPEQVCTWADNLTGRQSRSLGTEDYSALLLDAGLTLISEFRDEGEQHYYDTSKL